MKVALVYDQLNKIGGAERVLVEFARLFPKADWYTSFWDPVKAPYSSSWRVTASWLNKIPFFRSHHEWFPYLMPFIFESFDFSSYELVISISAFGGKGVLTKPGTFHLNYCLTPTRFLWSHESQYLSNSIYRFVGRFLRKWDEVASTRPDKMISISNLVKTRIEKYYSRESELIYPPVDTFRFTRKRDLPIDLKPGYYLVVSRLVPYKKIDCIVESFRTMPDRTLIIIGEGSEKQRLMKNASKNILFLGLVSDTLLPSYYKHCRAFIQINEEDFGIAMVEAQASGVPVLGSESGGAKDIIVTGQTGVLLSTVDVANIQKGVCEIEAKSWDKKACRKNAVRFDTINWQKKILEGVNHL